eukprot:8016650-Pyramimonas_sp.AAC.1
MLRSGGPRQVHRFFPPSGRSSPNTSAPHNISFGPPGANPHPTNHRCMHQACGFFGPYKCEFNKENPAGRVAARAGFE